MLLKAKDVFVHIKSKEEITQTSPNQIVRFSFCKELLRYTQKNSIPCAVEITSIAEAIYANHYDATYIIAPKKLASTIQQIADNYLFDTKILVEIRFEWEIEELALKGIDGVILEAL